MASLSLKSVSKVLNGNPIIQNFSIDIHDGEFIVVVGPSGCGKSTLLRIIAGLEEVTQGEIRINNQISNHMSPKDRNVAMVFQNYALYPHMNVYNNIAYGLRMRKFAKQDIKQRVQKTAEMLQLDKLLDRQPRELSGGQRQRVAMGRAIIREPDLFLFDEPLSNLDAKLRVQMRLEIKKLQQNLNITSIYVTHDQVEAMTLADRIIVLNHGVIEQVGSPLEIYDKPASVFVASFIGSMSMNFLYGTVNKDKSTITVDNMQINMLSPYPDLTENQSVIVGIRPEHISLDAQGQEKMILKISQIETLGTDTLIYGYINNPAEILTVRVAGSIKPKIGESINIYFSPQHIHLFDAENKKAIARS